MGSLLESYSLSGTGGLDASALPPATAPVLHVCSASHTPAIRKTSQTNTSHWRGGALACAHTRSSDLLHTWHQRWRPAQAAMNDDALVDANKQVNGAASNSLLKALHVNSTEKIFVLTPRFHKAALAMPCVWLCVCARIPKFVNFCIIFLFWWLWKWNIVSCYPLPTHVIPLRS